MFLKNVSYSNNIYLAASLSIVASLSSRNHYVATTFTGQDFNEKNYQVSSHKEYIILILYTWNLSVYQGINLDGGGYKTAIAKTTSELS